MNPKQFKTAIARQCGFEPLDGDDLDELYAEEQARQYEHSLFSKAANEAFEHAPIKQTEETTQL